MQPYKNEIKKLIKLSTPVLVASIAQTGMSFVDTIMAGGVSAIDLAAVSVASSIWMPSILFGIGLLMALVPVVAQLNGSGRQHKIASQIFQGGYLSLIISVPIILVLLQTSSILDMMDVEALMADKTIGYIYAVIFAVPAFLLFQTLRSYAEGMSLTKPGMVIGFIGLLINIPLNWIFVYGKFGVPALGGVGCGVATMIVYWLMFFMLLFYVATSNRLEHIKLFTHFQRPELWPQWRLFKLGLPVAAALFFEVTLFAVIAVVLAPLGSLIVAAHQVAINFASLIFMLPMSIAAAVSIRVGHTLGEDDTKGAAIASNMGLFLGVSTAFLTAALTVLFREQVAYIYTENREVVSLAMKLLLFSALYQCTDAIQVIGAGALRGYKDMNAIFIRTFIAYWILGMPTGYILAMTDWVVEPMGAQGFWVGIIVGLSSAAVMLGIRLHWIQKQDEEVQLAFAAK